MYDHRKHVNGINETEYTKRKIQKRETEYTYDDERRREQKRFYRKGVYGKLRKTVTGLGGRVDHDLDKDDV